MAGNSRGYEVTKSLEAAGVQFVRILWCDNANIIRGKAVHLGMLSHYLEHGVGISAGQQGVPVMYDAVVPESGLGPVGEIRLVPDWSSLTPKITRERGSPVNSIAGRKRDTSGFNRRSCL